MYTLTKRCRACGYGEPITAPGIKANAGDARLIKVLDLGLQPLANDFRKDGEAHSGYAPLQVLFCPNCTLGQLSVNVDPVILYNRYSYVTSTSDMMKAHFKVLAQELKDYFTPIANVLEIGSNDGSLLKYLKDAGFENVYGMDPAKNLSDIANENGVPTTNALFSYNSANLWRSHYGTADIILARHVFCHIDDWRDFIHGISALSNKNTLIGIEVPYAKKMLENVEFDTVYHEHLSYLTLKSVRALLSGSGLHIHNITEYAIHGGTIIVWIRRDDYSSSPEPIVEEMLSGENIDLVAWQLFSDNSHIAIRRFKAEIDRYVAQGQTVCGFGASAKSTVWTNACGFSRKLIRFITDTTPWKQWTTSPGTDIPIVDEGALIREQPDYAILFAWNYADEIIAKNHEYIARGGRFIVPITGTQA